MELIAKIVMLASCAVCVLVQTVYFTHMRQLNSYRNERYRKWCKDHEEKVVNLRRLLPALWSGDESPVWDQRPPRAPAPVRRPAYDRFHPLSGQRRTAQRRKML